MRYTPDPSVPLRWFDMFTNTIEGMIFFGLQEWDKQLPIEGGYFYLAESRSHLAVAVTKPGVQCKYAIIGLYDAGLEIASGQRYNLFAGMRLHNNMVGFLQYKDRLPPSPGEGTGLNTSLVAAGHGGPGTSGSNSTGESRNATPRLAAAPMAGWVSDPDYPNFKLFYRCRDHRSADIDPAKIFTAVVEAFALAAQEGGKYGLETLGSAVYSTSADEVLAIGLFGSAMSWIQMIQALATLWRQVICGYTPRPGGVWKEMEFKIYAGDTKIGTGYVTYVNPRKQSQDASTLARETS
ncbi:MAG: hypothetical protein Q9182_001130 [Xanthomendoza sp. 2 TL-2023]